MDLPYSLYLPVLVWLAFFCLIGLFFVFYRWAKKRKGAALAIGLFIQMMNVFNQIIFPNQIQMKII